MTKEEAGQIIKEIDAGGEYYRFLGNSVKLDGDFTADQLEAFVVLLRAMEA